MPGESGVFVIDDDDSGSLLDLEEFDIASTSTSASRQASRRHISDTQATAAAPSTAAVTTAAPKRPSQQASHDSEELTDDDDDEFHIAEEDSAAAASFSLTSAVGATHAAGLSSEPFLLSELVTTSSGLLKKSPVRQHGAKVSILHPPPAAALTSSPSAVAMSRLMDSIREVDRKPTDAAALDASNHPVPSHPEAVSNSSATSVAPQLAEVVFRVLSMLRALKLWQQVTLFTPVVSTFVASGSTRTLAFIQNRLQTVSRGHAGNVVQWNLSGVVPAIRWVRLAASSSAVLDDLTEENNVRLLLDIADTAAFMLLSATNSSSSIWVESSVVVALQLVWEVIALMTQQDKGAHTLATHIQQKRLLGRADVQGRGDPFALAMDAARASGLTNWTEYVLSAMHDVVLLGRWQQHYLLMSHSAAAALTALHQVSCERAAAASSSSCGGGGTGQFVGTPAGKVVSWKHLVMTLTASLESLVSDVASLLHNDQRALMIPATAVASSTSDNKNNNSSTSGMNSSTTSNNHVVSDHDDVQKVQQLLNLLYGASARTAVFIANLKQLQRSASSSKGGGGALFSQPIAMLSACVISVASTCLECFDGSLLVSNQGVDEPSAVSFVVESLLTPDALGTWFTFMDVLLHAHNDAPAVDTAIAAAVSDGDRSDAAWSRVSLFEKPLSSFYFGGGSQVPRASGGAQLSSLTSSLTKRDLNPNGGSPVDVLGATRIANKEILSEVLDQLAKFFREIDKRFSHMQNFEGQYRRGTVYPATAVTNRHSMQGAGAVVDVSVKQMSEHFYAACMSHRSSLASALTISSCLPLRTVILEMLLHFATNSPAERVVELLGPRTLLRSAAVGSTDDIETYSDPMDRIHVILPCSRLLYRVVASSGFNPNGSEAASATALIKRLTEVFPSIPSSPLPASGHHMSLQHDMKSGIGALASTLVRIAEDTVINSDDSCSALPGQRFDNGWSRVVVAVDNYGGSLLSTLVDCVTRVPLAVDSIVPVITDLDHATAIAAPSSETVSRKYVGLTASSLTTAALHASSPALRMLFLTLVMHWLEVDVSLCDGEHVQNDLLGLMMSGSPADMGAVAGAENPVMCLVYVLLQVPLLHGALLESSVQRLLRTSISMLTTLGCDKRLMFSASRYISLCITSKQFAKKAAMDSASLVSQMILLPVVNRNIESTTLSQVVLGMASLAVSDKDVFDLIKQDSVNAERMFLAVLTACNVKPAASTVTPPASPLLAGSTPSSPASPQGTMCGLSKSDVDFIAEVWEQIVKARQDHNDTVKHESERKILQEAALSMEELRRKYEAEVELHEKTKKNLEQSVMLNATNASSLHGSEMNSSPNYGDAAADKKLNLHFDQSSRSVDVMSMHSSDRTAAELGEAHIRLELENEALIDGYLELLRQKDELLCRRDIPRHPSSAGTSTPDAVISDEASSRLGIEAMWLQGSVDLLLASSAFRSEIMRQSRLASAMTHQSIEEAISPTRDRSGSGRGHVDESTWDQSVILQEFQTLRDSVIAAEDSERIDVLLLHFRSERASLQRSENSRHAVLEQSVQRNHQQSQQQMASFVLDSIAARDQLMAEIVSERLEMSSHVLQNLFSDRADVAEGKSTDNSNLFYGSVSESWISTKNAIAEYHVEESYAFKIFFASTLSMCSEQIRLSSKRHETEVRDLQSRFQSERRDREKQIREESMTAFSAQVATSAKIQLELDALKISYAKLDADSKEEIRCALEGSGLNNLYKKKEDLLKSLHQAKVADLQRGADIAQQQAAAAQEKSIQAEQQHLKTIAALRQDLDDLQKSMKTTESATIISGSVHSNAVAVIRDQANKLQQQLSAEESLRKQLEMKVSNSLKEHLREVDALNAKHRAITEAAQARFDQQLIRQLQDSRKEAAEREGQERVLLEQRARESNAKASVLQAKVAELDNELQAQKRQSTEDIVVLRATAEKLQATLKSTAAKHAELEKSAGTFEKLYNEERKSAAMAREQVESLRMDFNLEKLDMQRENGRLVEMLNNVTAVSDRQAARLVEQEHFNDVLIKRLAMLELEDEVMHKTRGLEAYTTSAKLQSRQGESSNSRGAHLSRLRATSPAQQTAAEHSSNASHLLGRGKGSLAFEAAKERDKEQFQIDRQEAASLLAQYTLAQQQYYDADKAHKGLDGSKVSQIKKLASRPSSMSGLKALSAKSQGARTATPNRKVAWAASTGTDDESSSMAAPIDHGGAANDGVLLATGQDRLDMNATPITVNDDSKQSVTWKEPFVAATALDFQRQEYRSDQDPHLHSFFRRMKR
jgi:hypothetical protein